MKKTLMAALVALVVGAIVPGLAQNVAKLKVTRAVQVTKDAAGAKSWVAAATGTGVAAGQGVRTLKRSLAEVQFNDGSVLRLNEQTDLLVTQTTDAGGQVTRKLKLSAGAVWVKVAKGVITSVETPSATATAKGTEFVVVVLTNGLTRVIVFRDAVTFQVRGTIVEVQPGQFVDETPEGGAAPTAEGIPEGELPVMYGGAADETFFEEAAKEGVRVTVGTTGAKDVVGSALGQTLQEKPWEGTSCV